MYYLGIDLGGTNIKMGIVNEKGEILLKNQVYTNVESGSDNIISNIISLSKKLIKDGEDYNYIVKAVGMGVPGPVDENGVVINCINLNWSEIPIVQILKKELMLPIFVENDGNAAAACELEAGLLRGINTGIVLTLGTGIGGGIIIDGKSYTGFHKIGAEIGHMIVGENFYNCNCGRNGCLETFSSANALIKYVKELLSKGEKSSSLYSMCNGDFSKIHGAMIISAAKEGDKTANKAVERAAFYLARGIINLVAVLDPEKIVIGGGMSKAGEWYLDKIKKFTEEERYFQEFPIPEIVISNFKNNIGIVGAAMIAKLNYIEKAEED
ncbi:ROK family protein [Anaerovorax odorimutans]|uniref:ROK family protein n=1 Tax=Anaerovorax odorimutans TaxID=109327 RepID=UPI0004223DFB|nr:ROK family protein [Anaerovorax odorimutans]